MNSDPAQLVLIVTGISLTAEIEDRPIAANIAAAVDERLRVKFAPSASPLEALVCSDIWRMNDPMVRDTPTISVGRPETNALTANKAAEIPSAFVIDDVLAVQMDLDLVDPVAIVWGVDEPATRKAASAFIDRYLDLFIAQIVRPYLL